MDRTLRKVAVLIGLPVGLALLAGFGIGLSAWQAFRDCLADPLASSLTIEMTTVPPEPAAAVLPTEEGEPLVFREIVVTGYASGVAETDASPSVTASMTSVRPGCLALSRDLLRTFTCNAPFDFGDWVVLPGVGVFIVQDTMHERWERRGDIWFPSRAEAVRWGRRRALIGRLTHPTQELGSLLTADPHAAALSRSIRFSQ